MDLSSAEFIHRALFGVDDEMDRQLFMEHFGDQVYHFEKIITSVYQRWQTFEKRFSHDQESGTVVGTLFRIIANLISSTKLLMIGNLTLSGAAKRQAIEAIALSLLLSKNDLPNKDYPYLRRLWDGKFKVNKAVNLLNTHRKELKLNKYALQVMEKNRNFYHQYSHPTILAMGESLRFDGTAYYMGSSFDDTKLDFYSKELDSRVGLSSILDNLIEGVTEHMREWPCFAK
jgi:hypothetical protein